MKESKNNVLLIYPAYTYPRKSPPLGIAYLASFIERAGFQSNVLDLNVEGMNERQFEGFLMSKDWILIGLSFMTNQFTAAAGIASTIKRILPESVLVAGGPHPSSIPERTMREIPELDLIVIGEGERALYDLLSAVVEQTGYDGIPGVCYRKESQIVNNDNCELIAEIDSLPFPAWTHLKIEKYNVFSIDEKRSDAPVFALLSSRGCPNHCIFCDSHTIFGRKFRARSADNMFAEVMELHERFGMLVFDFVDDLFTTQKERVLQFCSLIDRSGIPFRWMANARVNTVDQETLKSMKHAGCIRVDFGVESGDSNVRRLMKKNITDEQIISAHRMAKSVGLSTGSFVMVGNLGETVKSASMTINLLKDIGDDVMTSIACPFPGTELYTIATSKGWINSEDWSKYVTAPTYTAGYRPVMRTEHLSEHDILNSYFYINSFFMRKKFQRRFGRHFYVNPRFYRELVFNSDGFMRRLRIGMHLLKARLK
ncbi:MAG: B12-binding domain-containing radical SAM protein [Syntrophales bacterium]